jgi:hypothetical protein
MHKKALPGREISYLLNWVVPFVAAIFSLHLIAKAFAAMIAT